MLLIPDKNLHHIKRLFFNQGISLSVFINFLVLFSVEIIAETMKQ